MCGIAGFWSNDANLNVGRRMASRLEHRGPDDAGVWRDEPAGVVLAHRRLSILDVSPAGHQPMRSRCGRYTLVYNGEIYNHLELRKELEAEVDSLDWIGYSDTETLLIGLCFWGVKGCLNRLNGMFAFAFWDAVEQTLVLARDRMGEKPLYYGTSGNTFLFGSELKSLSVHPDWRGDIDRDSLALYLRHSYVPAPRSIYCGVFKLQPAHFVVIEGGGRQVSEPQCYWDLRAVSENGISQSVGSVEELTNELDVLLRDSVSRRMVADVPLGSLLSGGYDSTMIAALMQTMSERPIRTFSIGFYEKGYDEATHARKVAEYLGTDHTELYVTSEQAMEVIPKLAEIYDEPFSDSSQIPTYLVSQLARKHVSVSLSGDGGDELFYGYRRYFLSNNIWRKLSFLPLTARQLFAFFAARVPTYVLNPLVTIFPDSSKLNGLSDFFSKLADVLTQPNYASFYKRIVSHFKWPNQVVLGANEPESLFDDLTSLPALPGLQEQMMYLDQMTYLPDDILTKVDRASMAVGLETRVPLLDHRLVEFSWRVPTKLKYHEGQGKWLLRQVLYRYVPKTLMERPKMGFSVPIDQWLRGALKDWAETLLDENRLYEEGFFDPVPIRKMWLEHISGERNWHAYLWGILMFQSWLEHQNA